MFRKLHLAVENLGSMFRELLDASRFEAQVEYADTREPVEVTDLLDNLCHEFDALASDKGLSVRTHLRQATVLSDRTMLTRIIRNLVSNAIRYTEEGGVLVAVRPRQDSVWIEVWDSGRGIPDAMQEAVFNQFTQVETQDATKGHGLGLAIVRRLLGALGHELQLASIEGKGTRFRLVVPRVSASRDQVMASKPAVVTDPKTSIVTPLGTADTVLLIDDDPVVIDALQLQLQNWGFHVVPCLSGDKALAWVRQISADPTRWPALMISDYHLSQETKGSDLLADLMQRLPGVPAFIITSSSDDSDIATIKAAGFKRLSKPVKPAKLRALINYCLSQSA